MTITGKTATEISDSIRTLVQRGELRPGNSLPPVRELADSLGVNRNTVAAAYQRLVQTGVAITQGRLGTAIRRASEQEGLSKDTALNDLADGNPNPDWLPDPAALLSSVGIKPCLYGEDTILPELRAHGEAWLGNECPSPSTLELTNGAVDAIERLAAARLTPGDKVAVEDPCFLGTISALRLAGMRTVGVEVDAEGMKVESLQAALQAGVKAVLVTPRAHNPTGCSLTQARAAALRDLLAAYPNVMVIVDDHFGLLAETPYFSVIPEAAAQWAMVRSVSKGFGPDLRVAFVACDPITAERMRTRLASGMTWVSHILQAIIAAGLRNPEVMAKIDGARDDYARRREVLRAALAAEGIPSPKAAGGFNQWIPVPIDAKDVAYALAKRGWLVRVGNAFDVQGQTQALRITISRLDEETAQRFARDLRACLS